jgi:hypothetical protein
MKITGPGPIRPTTTRPSRVSRGAKSAEFSSQVLRESEAANHAVPVTTVGALGGLLAAQEVPDATDDRSRGIARGADLLDRLDEIRHALLRAAPSRARGSSSCGATCERGERRSTTRAWTRCSTKSISGPRLSLPSSV